MAAIDDSIVEEQNKETSPAPVSSETTVQKADVIDQQQEIEKEQEEVKDQEEGKKEDKEKGEKEDKEDEEKKEEKQEVKDEDKTSLSQTPDEDKTTKESPLQKEEEKTENVIDPAKSVTETKPQEEPPNKTQQVTEDITESDDVQVATTTSGEDTAGGGGGERDSKTGSSIRQDDTKSHGDRKSLSSQTKRREKRKKKRMASVPKLRRRSSTKLGTVAEQYLQNILYPYFISEDPLGAGLLPYETVIQVLYSPALNLQLTEEDLPLLQSVIEYNEQGYVDYIWLSTNAHKIITYAYTQKPEDKSNSVEVQGIDGTKVMYNKKSGEIIDHAEDGMDLFEATISDLFQSAETDKKGFVTKESLTEILKSKTELDASHINDITNMLPEGDISYETFKPIGKEVVLKVYQATDQSDSEWMYLNSPKVGGFYLNKLTGETRRDPTLTEEKVQEAAFIENAYSQINTLTLELEQEKERSRELENQIAQFNENLEETVAQLDDTGRLLDIANMDLQTKEEEISKLQSALNEQDKTFNELSNKGAQATTMELELERLKQELTEAYQAINERDVQLRAQEQAINDLNFTIDSATDELKNAHGVIDAKDSSINSLQYNLTNEQGRVKELTQKMPSLESKLSVIVKEMSLKHKNLEEKSSQLLHTRKQLKGMREKNTELEKRIESLENMREKLAVSENENYTLKSFLTTKTAMIEKRKREIQELREKMSDMESRDNRRAIILADVLEKTARAYQQQLHQPPSQQQLIDTSQMSPRTAANKELRPISAPLPPPVQLEDVLEYQDGMFPSDSIGHQLKTSRPVIYEPQHGSRYTTGGGGGMNKKSKKKLNHIRSQTVPRLPPIHKQRPDFGFVTNLEMKQKHRKSDAAITKHTPTTCSCEVCAAKRGETKQPEYLTSLSGKTGLDRLREETDKREEELANQVKIGQRVLVQIKKSIYDFEPQKLTGVIKFIGKIDSEYMDNRIYVGVKLDEPAGNTNGIYKGKKYFECPPGHGRMLHITNVLAVMPRQGIVYKPLQLQGGQEINRLGERGKDRRLHDHTPFQVS